MCFFFVLLLYVFTYIIRSCLHVFTLLTIQMKALLFYHLHKCANFNRSNYASFSLALITNKIILPVLQLVLRSHNVAVASDHWTVVCPYRFSRRRPALVHAMTRRHGWSYISTSNISTSSNSIHNIISTNSINIPCRIPMASMRHPSVTINSNIIT